MPATFCHDEGIASFTYLFELQLERLLELAESELATIELLVNSRLARLRWRNAVATINTWSRLSSIQSSCFDEDNTLQRKVEMLEKLSAQCVIAERRASLFGRRKKRQDYGNASDLAGVISVSIKEQE